MFSKRLRTSWVAFAMLGAVAPELQAQTASEGEAIYTRRCASCHRSGSPVGAPVLGTVVSYAYARFSGQVRAGRDLPEPQVDMPAFRRAELSDRDVCALYLHVRAARPDAVGETATLCGFKPPAGPGADPGSSSGSGTPAPPAPPNPALEANRRHFAPARGTTYRLDCRGGDSAAGVMMAGSDGSGSDHPAWRYRLEFLESRGDASLRQASCIWVGPAPPVSGTGAYRLRLEWSSALSPAFQTMSYRAVDDAIRVDSDRRLLYPPLYRELVEVVSRPDATFAFEVWYPPRTGGGRGTQLQVAAAAVQRSSDARRD
jgi:hypothetical protein